MNIAFAGFRHGHIYSLYEYAKSNPRFNIVAAWEDDLSARTQAEEKSVKFTHASYDDLLSEKSIDIVAIGNFYSARGQMIIDALKAGKHVISDKPLCTSLSELEQIERLANDRGLKVGCMLDLRYKGFSPIVKNIISSGKLGEIHAINFTGQHCLNYGSRPNWYFEDGKHGGTINDLAVHGIDLVRHLTGLDFNKVLFARCWNAFADNEPNFKDCAQFMAQLSNGAGVTADVSYSAPKTKGLCIPMYWRFTFWGKNGVAEFNLADNFVRMIFNDSEKEEIIPTKDSEKNCLDDFLLEIDGGQTELNTRQVILSARQTLEIQAASI